MIWSACRTIIRNKLSDPNALFWTNAELLSYANEIQLMLTTGCEATIRFQNMALTSGQRVYALPDDLYEIRSVRVNGLPVFGSAAPDLEDLDTQFLTAEGTPQWYYTEGVRKIAFYPIPGDATFSNTFTSELGEIVQWSQDSTNYSMTTEFGVLTQIVDSAGNGYVFDSNYGVVIATTTDLVAELEYVYRPVDLSLDTDTPDLPTYMQWALIYGVVWKAAMISGKTQNSKLAAHYFERFNELKTEWFGRNKALARGQNQMVSQRPVDWGSDMALRQRVFP